MGLIRCLKEFKALRGTLKRFVKSGLSHEECVGLKGGRKFVLPGNMKEQLVEFLSEMDNRFYGLTALDA